MTILLIILFVTIVLFVWGKFTPDIVALLSMISLFLFGILDLNETLSGFSNPTVIMIAALFIIGEGLSQTGWTAVAGQKFMELAGGPESPIVVIPTAGSHEWVSTKDFQKNLIVFTKHVLMYPFLASVSRTMNRIKTDDLLDRFDSGAKK